MYVSVQSPHTIGGLNSYICTILYTLFLALSTYATLSIITFFGYFSQFFYIPNLSYCLNLLSLRQKNPSKLPNAIRGIKFFQLYRWSELQEKWILEILVLFNDKYAAHSPTMKLNNLVRVFFHINTFGKTDNMFGYRVMDYLFKYIKDTYMHECEESDERLKKEAALMRYFCNYIYTCISTYYSEQSYKLAVNQFKELIGMCGIKGHINRDSMISIMLAESARHSSVEVERLATATFNLYLNLTPPEAAMTLDTAKQIILREKEEKSAGKVSRNELFCNTLDQPTTPPQQLP